MLYLLLICMESLRERSARRDAPYLEKSHKSTQISQNLYYINVRIASTLLPLIGDKEAQSFIFSVPPNRVLLIECTLHRASPPPLH